MEKKKALKNCNFCDNTVPPKGQCNKCGFIDGIARMPTPEEFQEAKRINQQHSYSQYHNLDSILE